MMLYKPKRTHTAFQEEKYREAEVRRNPIHMLLYDLRKLLSH